MNYDEIQRKDGFFITHYISDGATAGNYDVIFTALHPCEVLKVSETHRVACSSTGTLNIEKLTTGQALDAGAEILVTPYSLNSTADTPIVKQSREFNSTTARQLKEGDRLALKDASTLTSTAGVQITIYFKRLGKGDYQ